jgi:hypothetical protein
MMDGLPVEQGRIAERAQTGHSPLPRRRRTREYIPNSNSTQRPPKTDLYNLDSRSVERTLGGLLDENMNTLQQLHQKPRSHVDVTNRPSEKNGSQLGERFHILKAENKILRERLQNALQREMKALKTFKRLAKENRQLKLNVRKYERTLLGFYEDESGEIFE